MAKSFPKTTPKRRRLMETIDQSRLKDLIGKRLMKIRLIKELTPAQFETLSGIEPRNLRRYESGGKMPSMPTIMIMASALGVSHLELLAFEFEWKNEARSEKPRMRLP